MNLKELSERAPAMGAFLIFIGFLKLYLYYNHWDINIAHYLDFSEIILSFLNDINTMLFFIVVMVVQATLGVAAINSIDRKVKKSEVARAEAEVTNDESTAIESVGDNNNRVENDNFPGVMAIVDEIFTGKVGLIICLCTSALFTILFLCFSNITFLYLTFIFFLQLVLYFLDDIIGIKDETVMVQTAIATILIGFTLCTAKYQAVQTETTTKRYVFYKSDKEIITTNKTLLYLGKTNNYYFYYDEVKKVSFILPSGSIDKTFQIN